MDQQTFVVKYDSNNSGGEWWLEDADWQTLEREGWTVEWLGLNFCHESGAPASWDKGRPAPNIHEERKCPGHRGADSYEEAVADPNGRWLGSLARGASIEIEAYSSDLAEGVASEWWANSLGKNPDEEGCNCCGPPHGFYARAKAKVPA